jgi:hypothetical protein
VQCSLVPLCGAAVWRANSKGRGLLSLPADGQHWVQAWWCWDVICVITCMHAYQNMTPALPPRCAPPQVAFICHVPKALQEATTGFSIKEWAEAVAKAGNAQVRHWG